MSEEVEDAETLKRQVWGLLQKCYNNHCIRGDFHKAKRLKKFAKEFFEIDLL